MTNSEAIRVDGLHKHYKTLHALKGISFGVIVLREQVQLGKFMLFTNRLKMIPVLLELVTMLDLNFKFSLEFGFDYFNLYDPVREIVADSSFFQELGCL